MEVKFIDLKAQYSSIRKEIDSAIQSVIEKSAFSAGPFVECFERNFARAHQATHCLGVNSGTSALHLAMWALGIRDGDEVIVPANTFFATPEAVSLCSAQPVFVDCDPEYFNIDPTRIKKVITKKTKAIIAVHLYGQPAQIDEIKRIADEHNLLLIEDCAQSHLAEYKGVPVGTAGICGCFSFYPSKNLGSYGEAGAVVTGDEQLYQKMLAKRDHGSTRKYYHDYIGHNYRMEGLQGAILDVKLRYLPQWTEKRRKNADLYRRYLADNEKVISPKEMSETKHVYHLFVVRAAKRNELKKYLQDHQIYTGIHYPIPCHFQKAYEGLHRKAIKLPVSEHLADEILSLPMYPELEEIQIEYISKKIHDFYHE
jgi:dTDP-4-amino-4,6-dideoxygalactose transaminase